MLDSRLLYGLCVPMCLLMNITIRRHLSPKKVVWFGTSKPASWEAAHPATRWEGSTSKNDDSVAPFDDAFGCNSRLLSQFSSIFMIKVWGNHSKSVGRCFCHCFCCFFLQRRQSLTLKPRNFETSIESIVSKGSSPKRISSLDILILGARFHVIPPSPSN